MKCFLTVLQFYLLAYLTILEVVSVNFVTLGNFSSYLLSEVAKN